eukprot:gene3514-4014_t
MVDVKGTQERNRALGNYLTQWSGLTKELLDYAPSYAEVQSKVINIIKDKVIVGHDLRHDFKVIGVFHPARLMRDSSIYPPFMIDTKNRKTGKPCKRSDKLKELARKHLGIVIQNGAHSAEEDAKASIGLYNIHKGEWDKQFDGFECKYPLSLDGTLGVQEYNDIVYNFNSQLKGVRRPTIAIPLCIFLVCLGVVLIFSSSLFYEIDYFVEGCFICIIATLYYLTVRVCRFGNAFLRGMAQALTQSNIAYNSRGIHFSLEMKTKTKPHNGKDMVFTKYFVYQPQYQPIPNIDSTDIPYEMPQPHSNSQYCSLLNKQDQV